MKLAIKEKLNYHSSNPGCCHTFGMRIGWDQSPQTSRGFQPGFTPSRRGDQPASRSCG